MEQEETKQIVNRVAKKIGIEVNVKEIDVVQRSGKKRDEIAGRVRPIIVKMFSKKLRDAIRKKRRTTILNSEIINSTSTGKIYVVEQLSSFNKSLLWGIKKERERNELEVYMGTER